MNNPSIPRTAAMWLSVLMAWITFTADADDLRIDFAPRFRNAPLKLDSTYQTAAGQSFSVTRLDLLLSDFALRRGDGTWLEKTNWQGFLSVSEGKQSFSFSEIPGGKYDRIRFHVGLTPELNHSNPAKYPADHPLNPNLNGLHWGWKNGYVFFAIEGRWSNGGKPISSPSPPQKGGEGRGEEATFIASPLSNSLPTRSSRGERENWGGYSFHLGNDFMLMPVELPVTLDLNDDAALQLVLNVDEVFGGKRALHFSEENSSTHSREDDKLAIQLRENVKRSFSIRSSRGDEALADQSKIKNQKSKMDQSLLTSAPTIKGTPYRFTFSAQFPMPDLPRDNPLTEEGVELGHRLFDEKLLSINNKQSCASCHRAESAFSDPDRRFSPGAEGRVGNRNSMPIFNLAWKKSFFWDGRTPTLREQVLEPIQNPIEMHETLDRAVAKLSTVEKYKALFEKTFGSPKITADRIARALEQFLLTQMSFDSKFDRALDGRAELTEEEKRGFQLFMTEYDPRHEQFGADCFHCHGGPFFTTHGFANNGLDSVFRDKGRFVVTTNEADRGKFSVPSLRNVEVTGPYMHDGRFQTLEEVVEHYSSGVKSSATLDPNLAKHPSGGIPLSDADKKALVAFLKTLTDTRFLTATSEVKVVQKEK